MNYESFGKKIIQQQGILIKQLEEQLAVYREKDKQQELASFRSGEIYVELRADYETIIRNQNITIQKLRKERDNLSFSRKTITRQWMEVLEDVQKECEKETKKLKQV